MKINRHEPGTGCRCTCYGCRFTCDAHWPWYDRAWRAILHPGETKPIHAQRRGWSEFDAWWTGAVSIGGAGFTVPFITDIRGAAFIVLVWLLLLIAAGGGAELLIAMEMRDQRRRRQMAHRVSICGSCGKPTVGYAHPTCSERGFEVIR